MISLGLAFLNMFAGSIVVLVWQDYPAATFCMVGACFWMLNRIDDRLCGADK